MADPLMPVAERSNSRPVTKLPICQFAPAWKPATKPRKVMSPLPGSPVNLSPKNISALRVAAPAIAAVAANIEAVPVPRRSCRRRLEQHRDPSGSGSAPVELVAHAAAHHVRGQTAGRPGSNLAAGVAEVVMQVFSNT